MEIPVAKEKMATPIAQKSPDPSSIMQIGMGFWASKALLAAVKFQLFTLLSGKSLSGSQIKEALHLKTTDRHVYDWLDLLLSLHFLEREGTGASATYSNTADTAIFLDKTKQSYIGGILEMANNRLYRFWADLEEALTSGLPQNESKLGSNMNFFSDLYKDQNKLEEFMNAMSGIQMGNFMALAKKFDFGKYATLADLGGADGWLSIQLCLEHPHLHCTTLDMPPVEPLAMQKIAQFHLQDRINAKSIDLLQDEFPSAEIITMGNILHGMNEEAKLAVINKAFRALPKDGVFIAIENVIDNERKQNTFGLMMSLNMLIENGDGFDYTATDFETWAKKAGFKEVEIMPLAGPTSAAIAYK